MRSSGDSALCKSNYADNARPVKEFVPQLVGNSRGSTVNRGHYREAVALVYRQNLLDTCGKIPLTHSRPGQRVHEAPPWRIRAMRWDSSSKSWTRKGERPAAIATKGSSDKRLVHWAGSETSRPVSSWK